MSSTTDARELPVGRFAPEQLTDEPLADPQVGDEVIVYSRGAYRLAEVTKIGPKRIEAKYTTEGAWKSAEKILAMYLAPGYVGRMVQSARNAAGRNYDNYYSLLAAGTYRFQDSAEPKHVEHAKEIAALGREGYVEQKAKEERQQAEATVADANERGIVAYLHYTTKSVPRSEVFGRKEG